MKVTVLCFLVSFRAPFCTCKIVSIGRHQTTAGRHIGWDWLPMVTSANVLNAKFHETISEFHDLGRPNDERMRRQQSTSEQLSHGEIANLCETKHP